MINENTLPFHQKLGMYIVEASQEKYGLSPNGSTPTGESAWQRPSRSNVICPLPIPAEYANDLLYFPDRFTAANSVICGLNGFNLTPDAGRA